MAKKKPVKRMMGGGKTSKNKMKFQYGGKTTKMRKKAGGGLRHKAMRKGGRAK